jgi:formate hydrogenlyase subunit 3/multisubunit Na+/H+ antiporter MnhD subunit
MRKRQILVATTVSLCTFPPLVGFYGVWPAFAQLLPQEPARAFFLGFALGFAFAVLGIVFAISTSPGEQK